jgi:hypothetical protein
MRGHPLCNDWRDAIEYLVKGIGIRREDVAGRLVGSQAVLGFDLLNHKAIEAAEVSFQKATVDVDRLLELLGNYGSGRDRPDQRARNNAVDGDARETLRRCMGLSDARCV